MTRRRQPRLDTRQRDSGINSSNDRASAQDRLPAAIRSCVQRLPTATKAFFAVRSRARTDARDAALQDLSDISDFLSSLPDTLDGPCSHEDFGKNSYAATAVADILASEGLRTSLLRLLAAGLRVPIEELPKPTSTVPVRHPIASAFPVVLSCISPSLRHACCLSGAPLPPHVLDFGRKLLRMQSLQALSRQMAAVAASLPQLDVVVTNPPNEQQQPQWQRMRPAEAKALKAAVMLAAYFADAAFGLLKAVIFFATTPEDYLWSKSPPQRQRQRRLYRSELAAALFDSCVMEHAAKLLLRLEAAAKGLQQQQPQDNDIVVLRHAASSFIQAYGCIGFLRTHIIGMEASPASAPVADQLGGILSGRCAHHAALLHGLASLCAGDDGPAYGLPAGLVERTSVEYSGSMGVGRGIQVLDPRSILTILEILDPTIVAATSGRRAGWLLALRVAELGVGSVRVVRSLETAMAVAMSVQVDHDFLNSAVSAVLATISSQAGLKAVLQPSHAVDAAMNGVRRARQLMRRMPVGPAASAAACAVWLAAATEWWRLVGAVARHVLVVATERHAVLLAQEISEQLVMEVEGDKQNSQRLSLEGALSGGLLPCLELLLRRAGANTSGPEAILLQELLCPGGEHGTTVLERLAVSLLLCPPRQAAGLVATLGKVLRRKDPRVIARGPSPSDSPLRPLDIYVNVFTAIVEEWAATWDAEHDAEPEGGSTSIAHATAEVAAPAGASASSVRRRTVLPSCVAWEWLPPLSRITKEVIQQLDVGSDSGLQTAFLFAKRVLRWLPAVVLRSMREARSGTGAGDAGAGSSDWRQLLLTEVDVVPLLGSVLQLYVTTRLSGSHTDEVELISARALVGSCCITTAAFPQQVRRAALAPTPEGWQPQFLRALVPMLEEDWLQSDDGGLSMDPVCISAEALAAQLEEWRDAGAAGGSGAAVGSGPFLPADEDCPTLLRRMGLSMAFMEDVELAAVLLEPAELRRRGLLRGCGNPGCSNLAEDSEAEVKLQACGRCGQVGYCCRECQVAHWKAGHKEACGQVGASG
ncbi:hypothetical protein Agub_g10719 [Astrephomene gubernaculifera]|uniref:phytol kinase n=1 Tax=Astrephomene gubernaculifera TaxID=47775 RepID=A0AAD3HPC3_9CHLO|nr:hypothetical protein Agub_g10719 [Astrephomene gubernaculifera]